MKELFSQLRKLTGVSLVASRDISGERPIIYFHNRSLRDVMIELSRLYGYYWLAKGDEGKWTYEFFEDVLHSRRRTEVRDSQDALKAEALLDMLDTVHRIISTAGVAGLAQLQRTNPRLYESVSDPGRPEIVMFLGNMDRQTLRGLLNDVGMIRKYTDLPEEMQASLLKAINVRGEARLNGSEPTTGGSSTFEPWTDSELQSAMITIKRWRYDVFSAFHISIKVSVPASEGQAAKSFVTGWPNYSKGEPDMTNLPEIPPGRILGDPLPQDIKITVNPKREQLYRGGILIGDVLGEIAEQANVDVIADFYFQETMLSPCTDEPLEKLVSEVCRRMGYTCQVEKNALRLRFNKWFLQPLPEEPSISFQESLWKKITTTGGLSLDDLLDIACLPGQQTFWGGFRFVPGAWQARLFPRTARLVRMLGDAMESRACAPEGLPVSALSDDQFSRIVDWAGVIGIEETPENLLRCVIRIEKTGDPVSGLKLSFILPDETSRTFEMHARTDRLGEAERRTLAAERAEELAADKVELSTPTEL